MWVRALNQKLLNEMILSEVEKSQLFKVFGKLEITAMMHRQEVKIRTTGCADDACLAEIGGAIGAKILMCAENFG